MGKFVFVLDDVPESCVRCWGNIDPAKRDIGKKLKDLPCCSIK